MVPPTHGRNVPPTIRACVNKGTENMAIAATGGGIATTKDGKRKRVGSTFTKTITQGPNKGDRVTFKVAPSGKPFPIRVLNDKGGDSTLRDNNIPFGKKKKKK